MHITPPAQPTINHRCENCHAFKVWVSYSFVQDEPTNAVKKGQAMRVDHSLFPGQFLRCENSTLRWVTASSRLPGLGFSPFTPFTAQFSPIDSLTVFVNGIMRSGRPPCPLLSKTDSGQEKLYHPLQKFCYTSILVLAVSLNSVPDLSWVWKM